MTWIPYILYVFIALSLVRLVKGPTIYDRLLALHLVSAQIILLMCLHAVTYNRAYYADVAMLYALLSFVETIAFVRFSRPRSDRRAGA